MNGPDLVDIARMAAGRYLRTRNLPASQHDDVLSDACWGAAQAAASHDPAKGAGLATHADRRSRGAILDGARQRSPVTRHHYARGVTAPQRATESLDKLIALGWAPHAPGCMEDAVADRDLVDRMLATCSERERIVLVATLLHGHTLADVGAVLGVSESRVGQIQRAAIGRLRRQFAATWLDAA